MQSEEISQHWSWHCQWAQPTWHYRSPISARLSPPTVLLLSPANNFTLGGVSVPRTLIPVSQVVRCLLPPDLYLYSSSRQSSWLHFSTLRRSLHTSPASWNFSHSLLYSIPGQTRAPGQTHPPTCPVDVRPPLPVWSDQSRQWWSWMMKWRTLRTWR